MSDVLHPTQANKRLRQARVARNWRQADLADQLGTTVASVKRWERGSHQPSAYYRVKLCALFEMPPQELGLLVEAEENDPAFSEHLSAAVSADPPPGQAVSPETAQFSQAEEDRPFPEPFASTRSAKIVDLDRSSVPLRSRRGKMLTERLGLKRWIAGLAGVLLLLLVLGGVLLFAAPGHRVVSGQGHLATPSAASLSSSKNEKASSIDPQGKVDPYAAYSTLVLSDDLTSGLTNPSQWDVSASGKAHGCFFINHTYDISSQGLNYCVADNTNFANFVYQVQLKIVQGHAAGIIFRTDDGPAQTYYIFEIMQDGHYFIQRNDSSEDDTQLSAGSNAAIKTGFNQPNIIAVYANGSQMTFYINGQQLTQLEDDRYSSGIIGVIVGEQTDTTTITEAAYNYVRVWT